MFLAMLKKKFWCYDLFVNKILVFLFIFTLLFLFSLYVYTPGEIGIILFDKICLIVFQFRLSKYIESNRSLIFYLNRVKNINIKSRNQNSLDETNMENKIG